MTLAGGGTTEIEGKQKYNLKPSGAQHDLANIMDKMITLDGNRKNPGLRFKSALRN